MALGHKSRFQNISDLCGIWKRKAKIFLLYGIYVQIPFNKPFKPLLTKIIHKRKHGFYDFNDDDYVFAAQ